MNKRKIRVVAYDSKWPDHFRTESKAISDVLTKEIVNIHHIGSTAVPGLAAKPIIDILLEVKDVNALDKYDSDMEDSGYTPKGEYGIPERRYYTKGLCDRTHHLHAFNAGSYGALRHIAFRDYLIAHPLIAGEYGDLKRRCASLCDNDIDKYCDMKNDFVKYHEEQAMQWMQCSRIPLIDDISDIAALYDSDPEKEHIRLERHQLEHDITWRYLNRYLPPEGSILEVGAATGRYTLELARRGYELTAVDISEKLIEKCRKRLADQGLEKQVRLIVADARDLNEVSEKGFSAVLLMGPLYHLVVLEDRKTALREAFSRLREGGIIFSSFISRFGILGGVLKNIPEWIEDQSEVRSVIEKGRDPEELPKGDFRGYFATVAEMAPLHEETGFETLVVAGVEPAISADDESYNRLQGKQRQLWLDLLYEASTEESVVGASRHLLYIGRKKRSGEC